MFFWFSQMLHKQLILSPHPSFCFIYLLIFYLRDEATEGSTRGFIPQILAMQRLGQGEAWGYVQISHFGDGTYPWDAGVDSNPGPVTRLWFDMQPSQQASYPGGQKPFLSKQFCLSCHILYSYIKVCKYTNDECKVKYYKVFLIVQQYFFLLIYNRFSFKIITLISASDTQHLLHIIIRRQALKKERKY